MKRAKIKQFNTPPDHDFFGVYPMVQLVHGSMVVPIDRNLLLTFTVRYGKGGANFYFSRVRNSSKQCPNDSSLFILPPKKVIKDREKGDWMNDDRGNLSPENRNFVNAVQRGGLRTHAWLDVGLNACW